MSKRDSNLFQESAEEVLEHAPCGFLSTLPDGTILRVNQALVDWTGLERGMLLGGKRFQDLLTVPGRIFYETHFAPLLRMQGFVREIACHIAREGRSPLPVLVNSRLKLDEAGHPLIVRTTIFDATERTSYEAELRNARRQAEQLGAIVTSSADAIISIDEDGFIETWNGGAEAMLGWPAAEAKGKNVADLIVPTGHRAKFARLKDRVVEGGARHYDTQRQRRDGSLVDVSVAMSRIESADGALKGLSLIYRDITERKQAEEQIKLLMGEVDHRSKNLLSVVRSIARLTKTCGDPEEFFERFCERLDGLAASHELLVRSKWTHVELSALVDSQLAHVGHLIGFRIVRDGPPLDVSPRAAQGIGMALHELATNSVKYGALSGDAGIVHIEWLIEHIDAADVFIMRWREVDGPPVSEPARTGFGRRVIVDMAGMAVGGSATLRYDPTGVCWELTAPFDAVRQ